MPFALPLIIFGTGAAAGFFGYGAVDKTADSVGNASGKLALAVGATILGYLILRKAKVL
jgi:hypothetical protein